MPPRPFLSLEVEFSDVMKRNSWILLSMILVVLAVGTALVGLSVTRTLARSRAEESARQVVSSQAEFVSYQRDSRSHIVRYFDASSQERWEVEVDRTSGLVRKYQTQKADQPGPEKTLLSDDELIAVVVREIPDASRIEVLRRDGPDSVLAEVSFSTSSCRGTFQLDPANGVVIARTVKFGKPLVIPTSSTSDSLDLLTLSEMIRLGEQRLPEAVLQDLDVVYVDGRFLAELDLYREGRKHILVLDALSGDEVSLESYADDWKEHGGWEPRMLEKPVLDIINWGSGSTSYEPAPEPVTSATPSISPQTTEMPSASPSASPSTGTSPTPTHAAPTPVPTTPAASSPHIISLARAKALVLSRLPEAVFEDVELEKDDGRLAYKGKAVRGTTEVDFELDAYTGIMVKWDVDTNED